MKADHEELLVRNPALLARIFWHLARKYSDTAAGEAPALPVFILSAGLLFHRETVEKIHRMNFESQFLKVVVDRPDLIGGLQSRIESSARPALLALQLGVAAGLLQRDGGGGFPTFRALGAADLPPALRDNDSPLGAMILAGKRLGAWFALEPFETVKRQLTVEF
ncbi:three component ABC system middle component [Sinorhizobium meliloti]|uniref:three component ABC system middle component n=1 Tax=Rhizobium meliloti TaxID=382 RepID=UPI0002861C97|nr:three component ABC system middle component [Sinorhizobium meliloti]ASP80484.1 hypothetical protein CDO27_21220 [Sinorhizobium meliloti]MQW21528.1 hypothetical protein [Sinorhizobium meliloti]CCM69852.1 hypothetical protein BN406_03570 [Sinorhizobium meliloti Rm41]